VLYAQFTERCAGKRARLGGAGPGLAGLLAPMHTSHAFHRVAAVRGGFKQARRGHRPRMIELCGRRITWRTPSMLLPHQPQVC
jgi:hypothetical protein